MQRHGQGGRWVEDGWRKEEGGGGKEKEGPCGRTDEVRGGKRKGREERKETGSGRMENVVEEEHHVDFDLLDEHNS